MKPLRLKFKGINSFSEQTEIDFEKLTRSGLFGIFGDTGSGKSTILDCISFALFGKIERSREKVDIINYRSDSAEVCFVFDVYNEGKRKKYTVERSIKKKNGLHKAMLYEDDKCIADKALTVTEKITGILGVDADDFSKCIALPQGEFSQFVKSQPADRITLIERLFSLYRYGNGLKDKLKEREANCNIIYSGLSAKLQTYGDVSQQLLSDIVEQQRKVKKIIDVLSVEYADAEKQYNIAAALGVKRAELDDTEKKLEELLENKSSMEELRESLKALPVCRSISEIDSEISAKRVKLSAAENKLSDISASLQQEELKLKELVDSAEKADYDGKISQLTAVAAVYASFTGKVDRLKAYENELTELRDKYRNKCETLTKLENSAKVAEKEVDQAENSLKNSPSSNLEHLINVEFRGAVLKDEYVNTLDYFVGLNGQLQYYKDKSALFCFIEKELKQQIAVYKDRVFQVKDFNLENARYRLNKLQSASEEREKLSALLIEKKGALKDICAELTICKNELANIKRDGELLRIRYNEVESELTKAFGEECKDYSAAEKDNKNALAKLKADKAESDRAVKTSMERISGLKAQLAVLQSEEKSLNGDVGTLCLKLTGLLAKSGYSNIESCKNLADKFGEIGNAESILDDYDKKLITLSERKKSLEATEGIDKFTADKLKAAENLRDIIGKQLSENRERLAVINSELTRSAARLEEKKSIEKEFAACEKERGLIAQLKEITRGNRFMEYIANEYLYDISALASSTLLNLTDGRYFLTYTDTFYAGDNFNGGSLRGVNTLSGGETFLVSLSLALALSQTICAKSLKSIEFFFLDEGFGTLDGNLVETVMSALEKLKSSRFTIGVISHVEELKHRIDSKITVYKATETHGSTVQMSC